LLENDTFEVNNCLNEEWQTNNRKYDEEYVDMIQMWLDLDREDVDDLYDSMTGFAFEKDLLICSIFLIDLFYQTCFMYISMAITYTNTSWIIYALLTISTFVANCIC
jgi:hypothetical protein